MQESRAGVAGVDEPNPGGAPASRLRKRSSSRMSPATWRSEGHSVSSSSSELVFDVRVLRERAVIPRSRRPADARRPRARRAPRAPRGCRRGRLRRREAAGYSRARSHNGRATSRWSPCSLGDRHPPAVLVFVDAHEEGEALAVLGEVVQRLHPRRVRGGLHGERQIGARLHTVRRAAEDRTRRHREALRDREERRSGTGMTTDMELGSQTWRLRRRQGRRVFGRSIKGLEALGRDPSGRNASASPAGPIRRGERAARGFPSQRRGRAKAIRARWGPRTCRRALWCGRRRGPDAPARAWSTWSSACGARAPNGRDGRRGGDLAREPLRARRADFEVRSRGAAHPGRITFSSRTCTSIGDALYKGDVEEGEWHVTILVVPAESSADFSTLEADVRLRAARRRRTAARGRRCLRGPAPRLREPRPGDVPHRGALAHALLQLAQHGLGGGELQLWLDDRGLFRVRHGPVEAERKQSIRHLQEDPIEAIRPGGLPFAHVTEAHLAAPEGAVRVVRPDRRRRTRLGSPDATHGRACGGHPAARGRGIWPRRWPRRAQPRPERAHPAERPARRQRSSARAGRDPGQQRRGRPSTAPSARRPSIRRAKR